MLARLARPTVAVPLGLGVVLVVLLVVGALLAGRAASAGRAAVGDTGPALAGVMLPSDGQAGSPTVTLAPSAMAHPRAGEVRDLLQRVVDARNAGDYRAWTGAVTDASASALDATAFAAQTRTVRIGSVAVRRIDPVGSGQFAVPMVMVSTQDPAAAPPDVRVPRLCWQITQTVQGSSGGGLRMLDPPRAGSSLRTPC